MERAPTRARTAASTGPRACRTGSTTTGRTTRCTTHVNTRAELKEYDPELAKLCTRSSATGRGDTTSRWSGPAAGRIWPVSIRPRRPRFRWREEPIPDRPRVPIQTELGDIELELDAAKAAPRTVKNFLRLCPRRLLQRRDIFPHGDDGQPTEGRGEDRGDPGAGQPGPGEGIFAADRCWSGRGTRACDTSTARCRWPANGPDTAQDSFSICVGDQPDLDFGGKRNPDGQGFAAFGQVVKGMDVVRKIHESARDGQTLKPAIGIQRAVRLN